jgi:hypothetical protein
MKRDERILLILCAVMLMMPLSAYGGEETSVVDVVFGDSGQNLGGGVSFAVSPGDVDGDGDLDAVVSAYQADDRVWLNDGDGTFTYYGENLGGYSVHGMALGDLDGDGDLDAFVVFNQSNDRVYLNDGTGHFIDTGQLLGLINENACAIALGDLDGDGDLDACTTHHDNGNEVWLNDGTGAYASAGILLGAQCGVSIALGDVDLDAFVGFTTEYECAGLTRLYFNETEVSIEARDYNCEARSRGRASPVLSPWSDMRFYSE